MSKFGVDLIHALGEVAAGAGHVSHLPEFEKHLKLLGDGLKLIMQRALELNALDCTP